MSHPTKNQKGFQERNDDSNPEHRALQKLLETGLWKRAMTDVDVSVSKLTAGSSESCKGAESRSTTWHPLAAGEKRKATLPLSSGKSLTSPLHSPTLGFQGAILEAGTASCLSFKETM